MGRRAACLVAVLAATAGCASLAPRAPGRALATTSARAVAPEPLPAAAAALPAGLYFRNSYVARLCDGCATPAFAVVLAVAEDPAALEAALARGEAAGLAPGYPFAVATAALGLAGVEDGGTVVAGLFAARGEAEALARALPGSTLLALATAEELQRRAGAADDAGRLEPVVVQVEAAGPGWDGAELDRIERELDAQVAEEPREQRFSARLAALAPRCTVRAGRVRFTTDAELYRFARRLAPASCDDGRLAWVPWTRTRLETLVLRTADGPRLYQVTAVMCDQATIEDWPYVRGGRTPRTPRLAASGGCRG
jgi:hypothetical protein